MQSAVHRSIASNIHYRLALLMPLLAFISRAGQCQLTSPKLPIISAAKRMITLERDQSDVMANLEYLSDRIGARLTGSLQLKKANDWTAETMKRYGLESVHLEGWPVPKGWERGRLEARILEPINTGINMALQAWSPGTKGKLVAPVVHYNPVNEAELRAFEGKLKGAILVTEADYSPPRPGGLMSYTPPVKSTPIPALTVAANNGKVTARSASSAQDFAQKVRDFAAKQGASAYLEPSGKPYNLLNMWGSWAVDELEATPHLIVASDQFAQVMRMLKAGTSVKMEVNATARFTGPTTAYNTIGEIKGSEKPEEVVIIGAHLDSWDLGTGTTDNGTGSMAVLEAAKLIKSLGIQPKRTIRFILFTGEEQGLFGSLNYVKSHKEELKQINVVLIHDIGTGRVNGLWLQQRPECADRLKREFGLLRELGLMTEDADLQPGKMNGTDHAYFDDYGVPAFPFKQDHAEYGLSHHSQIDNMDMVRPDDLKQGALTLAIMAWSASETPERYPRKPEPEVKKSDYHGFEREDFQFDGRAAILVKPKRAALGKPWIWRAEFFDHRPETDLALLAKGYHLAFIDVGNTFGCPDALKHWDAYYEFLTKTRGLSDKPALEGLSRGGLYCYNWAASHTDRVSCIYGDAPVLDFKSWPGGKGKGKGSKDDWTKLITDYHFADEAAALAWKWNPIDNLAPIAAAKIPLIHVCGDADDVVPYEENTAILKQRYEKLGGKIKIILKKGVGHHPHGLDDPAPIVEFILKSFK